MADLVRVEGAQKIALIGRALRQLGTDRTIVNEMAKRIRASAPELKKAIKSSAVSVLPHRGGLGAWVSRANIRVSVTRSDKKAGVSLVVGRNSAHGRTDVTGIDAGKTRHPLWGNRKYWYPQALAPGFATRVMDGPAADRFRADASDAIDAAVEQVLHVL